MVEHGAPNVPRFEVNPALREAEKEEGEEGVIECAEAIEGDGALDDLQVEVMDEGEKCRGQDGGRGSYLGLEARQFFCGELGGEFEKNAAEDELFEEGRGEDNLCDEGDKHFAAGIAHDVDRSLIEEFDTKPTRDELGQKRKRDREQEYSRPRLENKTQSCAVRFVRHPPAPRSPCRGS